MEKNNNIFNYVFHYNPFTKKWNAIPRDKYLEYWSNPVKTVDGVLQANDVSVLTEIIEKGEDFIKSIN